MEAAALVILVETLSLLDRVGQYNANMAFAWGLTVDIAFLGISPQDLQEAVYMLEEAGVPLRFDYDVC